MVGVDWLWWFLGGVATGFGLAVLAWFIIFVKLMSQGDQ